jgi:hypothetical protein
MEEERQAGNLIRDNNRLVDIIGVLTGVVMPDQALDQSVWDRPKQIPASQLYPFMDQCDEVIFDKDAVKWCEAQGLDPRKVSLYSYILRKGATTYDWCSHWPATGHRLLVKMYDMYGNFRSLKARCIESETRWETLNPKGFPVRGLVLANYPALRLLREGSSKTQGWDVMFCSGELAWLKACATSQIRTAIFGVYPGAWRVEHSKRIGRGCSLLFDDSMEGEPRRAIIRTVLGAWG